MWVASKISGAAGTLGAEANELRNWPLRFGFASEELRFVVVRLAYWMPPPPSPRAAYCALMACNLVALDKSPGVVPIGIGEMFCRDLAELVMRVARDQVKTVCGNMQL